jgi:hypothetical protein
MHCSARVVLALCGLACVAAPALAQGTFSIAVIPDTQFYARDNRDFFQQQTNWIVNNAASRNIRFATHLGDIVNDSHTPIGDPNGAANAQWNVATTAMSTLRNSSVPHAILPGNHDWSSGSPGTGNANHYRSRFGDTSGFYNDPGTGQQKSWFLGFDPRGLSSAQKFSTPQGDFLHLSLEWNFANPAVSADRPGATGNSMSWAQGIINANPNIPTIISTHNNINTSGARDAAGNALFNNLVKSNNQVFMVLNGHYSSGTVSEQRLTSLNDFGRPVHQVLTDYQSRNRGGDGWMRMIDFDPAQNRMNFTTYTPVTSGVSTTTGGVGPTAAAGAPWGNSGLIETDASSQFSIDLNFSTRFRAVGQQVVFRNGQDNYNGTQDTYITSQPSNAFTNPDGSVTNLDANDYRNANWGNLQSIFVDDAQYVNAQDGSATGLFHKFQGLIRFDDIFGSGAGQVSTSLDITQALLQLTVGGPSTDPAGGTAPGSGFRLVRMTRDWNEASNWNSLTDGVQLGIDTLGVVDATIGAPGTTEVVSGVVTVDVTAALMAWKADPSSNYGWALLPIENGRNGTRFWSSEAPLLENRPTLRIEVPAPGAAVLLTAGGLLMTRRRRSGGR